MLDTFPSAMHEKVKKKITKACNITTTPLPSHRYERDRILPRILFFSTPYISPHTLQTLSFHSLAPIPGALRFRCLVRLTNNSAALPNELEPRAVNNVRCTLTGGTGQQGRVMSVT
jgi:hypothetical protein